tara:strand:- start:199 stop:702 length:504 start_codon:yes stop_codon:yes gene_type:complete
MNSYEMMRAAALMVMDLEDSGGEISEEKIQELEELLSNSKDKLGSILAVRDRLNGDVSQHKEMIERHKIKTDRLKKALERLNNLAVGLLRSRHELGEGTTVREQWGTCSLTRRKSVEISNDSLIPAAFKTEAVTVKIDKKLLKKALESGDVAGALLIEKESVTWRTK